jgi:hypothetical protein
MQSNGLFEPGELQDFISESLSRIQEFFNGLLKPEALEDKEKEAAEDEENAELVAQPTQLFQMEEPQAQKVRELLIG